MLNLRELRKKRGISLKELGEIIGVAESTVSLYENEKRQPDFSTLNKLADYFNVTTDYLLGREEKTAPLEPSLTEKQQLILDLAEQLSDEDAKKLIDYAKLLKKANNQ